MASRPLLGGCAAHDRIAHPFGGECLRSATSTKYHRSRERDLWRDWRKVAFITGGGGGIGRATAERFAEEGAKVVIAEIDKERGEAAAQSACALARNSGGDAHFIHCDIRDKANVEAAFAQTVERFGKLTILHNNAGGSTPQDGPVTDVPEEEFWRVINLDLYGTFL